MIRETERLLIRVNKSVKLQRLNLVKNCIQLMATWISMLTNLHQSKNDNKSNDVPLDTVFNNVVANVRKGLADHQTGKILCHSDSFLREELTVSIVNPIIHGGGAQSARANFKDSYLRNEYCYCNEIW